MAQITPFPSPASDRDRDRNSDSPASHLIEPHGGELIDLMAEPERASELKAASRDWPSWDLTPRQFCDLELLMSGAFSPLAGFNVQAGPRGVVCRSACVGATPARRAISSSDGRAASASGTEGCSATRCSLRTVSIGMAVMTRPPPTQNRT